jgi:hypothetical protein
MLLNLLIPLKEIFFAADNNNSSILQSGSKKVQDILAGGFSDICFYNFLGSISKSFVKPVNRKKFRSGRGDGNVLSGSQFL